MREPSSDRIESEEPRCCVSSDADGRILTTSFPEFSHPLSIRPVPESFYHPEWFGSDNTGTAIAQVGRAISPVESSQRVENLRWHTWLAQPSSPVSSHVAIEGSRPSLDYRVSPGISELRCHEPNPPTASPRPGGFPPNELDRTSPLQTHDLAKSLSSSDSSEILGRYEDLVARLRKLEQFDVPVSEDSPSEHAVGPRGAENTSSGVKGHGETMTCHSSPRVHDAITLLTRAENHGKATPDRSDSGISGLEHVPIDHSSSQPPPVVQQDSAESEATDPDDAWKMFVFGDENSDEVCRAVFEEAKHDAVRQLQPSISPTLPDEGSKFDGHSNIATVGTLHTGHDNETSVSAEGCSLTETSEDPNAIYDASSTGSGSAPAVDISDEPIPAPSIEAYAGSSDVAGQESTTDMSGADMSAFLKGLESSTSELPAGAPSMTTSMAVAPARSNVGLSETDTAEEHFRFTLPKLFVGNRSNVAQPKPLADRGVGITLTKRKRGRQKKGANDGRADIRALPNYSSDPIEEFEDEARPPRGERVPKSLFPALELS